MVFPWYVSNAWRDIYYTNKTSAPFFWGVDIFSYVDKEDASICQIGLLSGVLSGVAIMIKMVQGPLRGAKANKKRLASTSRFLLEVPPRFELGNKGFADLCLTTWPRYQIK